MDAGEDTRSMVDVPALQLQRRPSLQTDAAVLLQALVDIPYLIHSLAIGTLLGITFILLFAKSSMDGPRKFCPFDSLSNLLKHLQQNKTTINTQIHPQHILRKQFPTPSLKTQHSVIIIIKRIPPPIETPIIISRLNT